MLVTSRTPLFLMLLSFVLTALQGCGADCKTALEESGLAHKKDGKDVEASKECTMGGGSDEGTDAPGRLLEDPITKPQNNLMGTSMLMSQIYPVQARIGRGLQDFKDLCKDVQKVVDCWGGKDGALCTCTCADVNDLEEDEDACKGKDDDGKDVDNAEKTFKEFIDDMIDDMKEMCKDDNKLTNPCDE